jgi:hypothetical protein
MSVCRSISPGALEMVVRSSGRDDHAITVCLSALKEIGQRQDLKLHSVSKQEQLKIFQRRLARTGFDFESVLGSERLLADLGEASEDEFSATIIEWSGWYITVWVDNEVTRMIACVSGKGWGIRNQQDASELG